MLTLAIVLALVGQVIDGPLEPLGRFADPEIREASGIVRSRRHPDIFWVHNDSGNRPTLFAVRRDGTLVRKYAVSAANIDWEDIATDDEGHLYIGDIGNNSRALPIRTIYCLDEPDPSRPADGPLKVVKAAHYRFPRRGAFDAEGLFIRGDRAFLTSKRLDGRPAELFAVPIAPPPPLTNPAFPERIATLAGFVEPATGADLSQDGRLLAVCSLVAARVYERREDDSWTLVGEARYEADGIEAICWDDRDLILAGEGGGIYRLRERSWRLPQGRKRR